MQERIEILPVSLLESESDKIFALRELAKKLNLEFGWHYLLDMAWILGQLDEVHDQKIIDAGAGVGVMQWYLAENGAMVISIDRESRANLPARFRRRYKVSGMREEDLMSEMAASRRFEGINRSTFKSQVANFVDLMKFGVSKLTIGEDDNQPGQVIIYNQDLVDMSDIPENSVDAIVAVSSLEHNSPDNLESVVAELMRVLKPGCALLASLGAARDGDWYHKPSKGWCYSEGTLRRIFDISSEIPSNFDQYDQLLVDLKDCRELSDNLASFYFNSGDNGMPWGKWAPEYQPVGICKFKGGL
jgi:SAM-dependent methyltransferase